MRSATVRRSPSDEVFRPDGFDWQPVSPALARVRRLILGLVALLLVVVLAWLAVDGTGPDWLVPVCAAAVLLGAVWVWWLIGRRVRSWGYAETPDELLVASGIILRRLVVVPYGRLQLVDVTAGPLDRAFGIATVQLHTAAATSDAAIPGLAPAEAAALRDRLAARGEQRAAGL
jgi:hypothetical protein